MKFNRYYKAIIPAAMAFIAAGCADGIDLDGVVGPDETPSEVTLSLAVPDFEVVSVASRADAAPSLSSLTVLCYGSADAATPLSSRRLTSGWSLVNNKIEVTVPIDSRTVTLQLVANAPENLSLSGNLSSVYFTTPEAGILWGKAALKDVLAKPASSNPIALVRANAKVSATSSASNFKVTGIGVYGTAAAGSVAPAGLDAASLTPNVQSGEAFGFSSGIKDGAAEIAIFETPKDNSPNPRARIIVRGTYNGVDGYYPVAFRTRSGSGSSDIPGTYTYTDIDIVRNHHYKVNVTAVRGEGYPTYDQAVKGAPDNRMTVLITDVTEDVNSIVAGRDYELGVSAEVDAPANSTSGNPVALITVVSSRPDIAGESRVVLTDNASWIKTEGLALPAPVQVAMSSSVNSVGYRYQISVPLDANKTADAREGTITVRSGELTRQIAVRQAGTDYIRDAARPVRLTMGSTTIENFFTWVATTLRGAGPEAFYQAGERRDDGLLFPAVPAYPAKYYIKKLAGETAASAKITSGSIFSVTLNGDYFEVTMNAQSPGITRGELTIVNTDGVSIRYPLYRCGYLHQLPASSASYQLEGDVRSGWYYYEVVSCGGYWTTDRNIGADSGLPYITTSAALKKNTGATGAYFKLAEGKVNVASNLVISKLGLDSHWNIPEVTELRNMNISTTDLTPSGAERTFIARMKTDNNSQLSYVYIPHTGYYEATSQKYETHANLWTKTLVSGSQGFSTSSPEYGYWVQYLDVYNTSSGFGNMRIANGSSGQVPTATSAFKYMPIRPVWK